MYGSLEEYKAAYHAVELKYVRMANKPGAGYLKKNLSVKRGYDAYANALDNALGFLIIGRTNVDKAEAKRVQGPAIENDMLRNFGGLNDGTSQDPRILTGTFAGAHSAKTMRTQGSILHYPSQNEAFSYRGSRTFADNAPWHFLINDSFILAGVHQQQEFHLASPRTRENLINPWGPSVTFRELIGLRAFGYTIRRSPTFTNSEGVSSTLNEVAYCANPYQAKRASFAAYWEAIDKFVTKPHEFVGPGCNW